MKILSANTALGTPGMNKFWKNIKTHIDFHGWIFLIFLLLKSFGVNMRKLPSHPSKKRVEYCKKQSTLSNTLKLLEEEQPDIIALQEVLHQHHQPILEPWFKAHGYQSWSWGYSDYHADACVSTVIASKEKAEPIVLQIPESMRLGGGGGIVGLRTEKYSFISLHLTHVSDHQTKEQLAFLQNIMEQEAALGREVIFMGDFNLTLKKLQKHDFLHEKHRISVALEPTCPTCIPKIFRTQLDHIILPDTLTCKAEIKEYDSDHAAIVGIIGTENK